MDQSWTGVIRRMGQDDPMVIEDVRFNRADLPLDDEERTCLDDVGLWILGIYHQLRVRGQRTLGLQGSREDVINSVEIRWKLGGYSVTSGTCGGSMTFTWENLGIWGKSEFGQWASELGVCSGWTRGKSGRGFHMRRHIHGIRNG